MKLWHVILIVLVVALVAAGIVAWIKYQEVRADYDAYRTLIQRGAKVAGVEVGWHTPQKAQAKVEEWVAEPYYQDFTVYYQDKALTLSPAEDLGFNIPVADMVDEAVAASHQYDYWEGFKLWIQDQAEPLNLDVPLRMNFDETAAERYLAEVAEIYDIEPAEPMIDVQNATFHPGHAGRHLDIEPSVAMINERVPDPSRRKVDLPVTILEPDQSRKRIESMLSTLVPVMEREPTLPSFFTATVPISIPFDYQETFLATGEIPPDLDYTGELTWTFPHLISYTGHLTTTYGYFFKPGEPGYTFNLTKATSLVDLSLRAGMTTPFTFEPELVPPEPITKGLVLPPLKARLAEFPGVVSILIKNLDTGEMLYESNMDYILSGMSLVKIGIMVEVYRYFKGEVDAQTYQEMRDMLGEESCNPCANRLMATVGGGSAQAGTQKVTATMRRLGLANFYICSPFRVVELWEEDASWGFARYDQQETQGQIIWTAAGLISQEETENLVPRYDRCVRATPREMATLVEMIYDCTEDEGLLRDAYPNTFSPQVCQEMVDIMAANNLRNMLGAGIPSNVKLAHKHGFSGYDVPWGDTRAEVGIIFAPGATWLIAFYIWEDTPWINWGINQPLYRDVSNMLYNYFSPEHQYWPLPPWAEPPAEETGEESNS